MAWRGIDTQQFFGRADVCEAIQTLRKSSQLSILAGAGVSIQARLPKWEDLVSELMQLAIAQEDIAGIDHRELAENILRLETPMIAATLAASVLRPTKRQSAEFADQIRTILYRHGRSIEIPNPGALAVAIARAQAAWGTQLQVATTNYDLLLEAAIKSQIDRERHRPSDGRTFVSEIVGRVPTPVVKATPPRGNSVLPIWHLHGYVGTEPDSYANPILTESDYHTNASELGWQQAMLLDWIEDGPLLIVGASLRDPDIVRIVFAAAARRQTRHPIVALLPRTRADIEPDRPKACSPGEEAHESMSVERWRQAGVTALYFDHFFQPTQFVNEVTMAKLSGSYGSGQRYCTRLDRWYVRYCEERMGFDPTSSIDSYERDVRFAAAQVPLSRLLSNAVAGIESLLESWGRRLSDERLSLHVWSRYPPERALAMTAASDRRWASLPAVNRRALWRSSRFAAVTAFCEGRWGEREDGGSVGHLGYQLALPIELSRPDADRLPVGVITLSSTRPARGSKCSVLKRLDDEQFMNIVRSLRYFGTQVLDPEIALA